MLSKGFAGIFMLLGAVIIFSSVIIAGGLFVMFFKYNIRVYIHADTIQSKSSLVPLSAVASTYDGNNFALALNNDPGFKGKLKDAVDLLFPKKNMCYKSVIEDRFGIDNFGADSGNPFVIKNCIQKPVYGISFPVPIIYDGKNLTKKWDFATYEVESSQIPGP